MISNFSWIIPQFLAGSAMPGWDGINEIEVKEDLKDLKLKGINCLVSLQIPQYDMENDLKDLGIKWIKYPIKDFGIPQDLNSFNKFIDTICDEIQCNWGVCIHCRGGIGRTGMVLTCVLKRFFDIDNAFNTFSRFRNGIETQKQLNFVNNF